MWHYHCSNSCMTDSKNQRLKNLRNQYLKEEAEALKFRRKGDYMSYIRKLRQARKLRIEYLTTMQIREDAELLVLN